MGSANILDTVNFYTVRVADITNELTDIMTSLTRETRKSTALAQKTNDERAAVKSEYEVGSDEYDAAMDDIDHKYEVKLADISQWESELQGEKTEKEVEAKEANGNLETYKAILKQDVQTDGRYGGGGGSQ